MKEIEVEGKYEILFRKIKGRYYVVGLGKNDNVYDKILFEDEFEDGRYIERLTEWQFDDDDFVEEYVIIEGLYQLFKEKTKNGYVRYANYDFEDYRFPTKKEIMEILNMEQDHAKL